MKTALTVFFAMLFSQTCLALASQFVQSPAKPVPTESLQGGRPCLFDREHGEVPDCIHKRRNGQTSISPKYLRELDFDSHGVAAVWSQEENWMYVNRKGRVIISGVPTMDNGADWFHNGLVRIVRNNRYGFANRKGLVVVPPIYDGAMNFEKGIAEVCMRCRSECASDCEYHALAGGEWFRINTRGTVLKSKKPK